MNQMPRVEVPRILGEQIDDEVVSLIRGELDRERSGELDRERDERLESIGQGFEYWELQWEKSTEYERMKLEEEYDER